MNDFRFAVKDFRFFKNKGYSGKSLLKLVGDRYRLSRHARNCLLRGISNPEIASSRRRKVIKPVFARGKPLGIDWYNVLITVEGYLKGECLFLTDDAVIRDAQAIHGSYRVSAITDSAIRTILKTCSWLAPSLVAIFLDAPVSFSGRMKEKLLTAAKETAPQLRFSVEVIPSPDYALKTWEGVAATSDSVIMDQAGSILDLPRLALQRQYDFKPKKIDDIIVE